ncbi:hypothetical protein [Halospeciosus flavus]|uniref:hypothetical protein n=1 Tax=Halospeciosus flavus TaxID=3032283 RepID=UPI0036D26D9C
MTRVRSGLLSALGVLAGLPGVASAHEISGRFDAPIPLSLLFGGAAVTVGVTALLLASTTERPTSASEEWPVVEIPPNVVAGLRIAGRGGFFFAFLLAVVVGFVGRQVPAENVATVFVWAVWLKGVAVVAALVGNPWRVLSPGGRSTTRSAGSNATGSLSSVTSPSGSACGQPWPATSSGSASWRTSRPSRARHNRPRCSCSGTRRSRSSAGCCTGPTGSGEATVWRSSIGCSDGSLRFASTAPRPAAPSSRFAHPGATVPRPRRRASARSSSRRCTP